MDRVQHGGTIKPSEGPDIEAVRYGNTEVLYEALLYIMKRLGELEYRLTRQGL